MKYKNFTLDQFQEDSIKSIEKNNSVVVSAATGTGKTLIADYVINKAIQEDKRAIYTAPIKALSNQKFREFRDSYGDKVGMLTGDVVINSSAQILIMTTEIYRNMLLEKSPDLDNVSYVIFDEIHFINDIERGTVWEESIIFSPDNIRFLCLSATIPNYTQFAAWISAIKHHTVDTVNYMKRAVPLKHLFYDIEEDIVDIDTIIKKVGPKNKKIKYPFPNHISLLKELELSEQLPCIFFSFSRALCEKRAKELGKKNILTTPAERKEIIEIFTKHIPKNIMRMQTAQMLRQSLPKGIGVHHAGILPKLKEVVEILFDKGLIKVLYATETFAVGINMPAKTVCFGALEKYDGISFRLLNSKEYFQLAGRAGRRGIDTVGYSISMIDRNHPEHLPKIKELTTVDKDPIISRYTLSYNTVLNLIKNHTEKKRKQILTSNFGYYMKKQQQSQVRIMQSFQNYVRILTKLDFIEDGRLTWKGEFATRIYTKELEVGELVYEGILQSMTIKQMAVTLAALIYEPRRLDKFNIEGVNIGPILKKIEQNTYLKRKIKPLYIRKMKKVVESWIEGCSFETLTKQCNLADGDIIRMFRQLIDILRQIKSSMIATDRDNEIIEKINELLQKIDRDLIAIEL